MAIWATWLIVAGFLLARSLLAGVEAALHGVSPLRAKELAELYPGAGRRLLLLKTEREASAAALRIGSIVCGFAAASLAVFAAPQTVDLPTADGGGWCAVRL